MKKPTKTYLRKKADDLCRELCYKRGKCEAAGQDGVGCKGRLEWAHMETRAVISIRYEDWNYSLWCSAHHWFYDSHPIHKAEWIKLNKGQEIYDRIKRYKPQSGIITVEWYKSKIEELKTLLC